MLTAAKISIETFFKKYNKNNIKKKISIKNDKIIRSSYYGGRTEVFGNPYENEKILHFDFEGMYASCMSEKVPGGNITFEDNPKNINKPGFYFIEFNQKMKYPILPTKEDKLLFKNGIQKGLY
jgi:hypothetical protein